MTDTTVVLGGVPLKGFEIPSKIPYGGDQALKVHKMLGGARTIDALGRDDMPLAWSGRFQGADAEDRARLIDQMRITGQQVALIWGEEAFAVVVEKFVVDWERFYQQPYSISCVVVTDNSFSGTAAPATLDDLVDGDMTAADDLAPDVPDTTIQPALDALSTVLVAVGTLQGASLTALAPARTQAMATTSIIGVALAAEDAATLSNNGTVGGVVAGGFAPTMAAVFEAQTALFDEQASLRQIDSLVRRVGANLAQATG